GRGAVDMKGFIAIVLASLPDIMAQADSLSMPLHVALSFDEETGFFGASQLPAFFDSIGLRAEIAIIGEPTNMQPFVGHKGGMELTTVVTGTSGHASQPAGTVNAVYYAARLVDFMRSCADDLAAAPIEGSPFNPPHTSLSVGVIRGGEARNIIPDRCEIDWEIRAHPGDDPHQYLGRVTDFITHGLVPEMTAIDPRAGIETHMLCDAPPLEARPDGPAANLVARLWTNETPQVVSFGTDAPFFQKAGMDTVIFGPGGMAQMHQPDEFITEAALVEGLQFIDRLAAYMRGGY
ncbi:MAG TPA: acetylornithine deacetylase, partial [Alphaproteobacteria bacterium]|nr:acetylornithine deacetylase [Alphaproteobacteria bacterium]